MKLLMKLLPLLALLSALITSVANADEPNQPSCAVQRQAPGSQTPIAALLAEHKCLLSHYNPNDPNTDYQGMTWDMDQLGIAQLIAKPEGVSNAERALVLNDYAFWQMKWNFGSGLEHAVDVLKLVVWLAPTRTVAWLNLGDGYRAEMDIQYVQDSPMTAQKKALLARHAAAAYWVYLVLSPSPLQRVRNYMAFIVAPNPPQAASWSTMDAIENMAAYPAAAAAVLSLDDSQFAKLALAMDIALMMPDPAEHKAEISALLNEIAPQSPGSSIGYDGTAGSFIPYLDQTAGNNLQGFPLTCGMIKKYPELLDATEPVWGGHRDDFNANVDCDDPKYQLPPSIQAYNQILEQHSGFYNWCGGATDDRADQAALENNFHMHLVQFAPSLIDPATQEVTDSQGNVRHVAIPLSALPLQVWGETDISSYNIAKNVAADFLRARADLAAYYRSVFGLSAADALVAAQNGVWSIEAASSWTYGGTPDLLAEALLGHKPLAQVQAALAVENGLSPSTLFLAVEYPDALKLLLAKNLDLTVTTPIGKTVLMEAAKYNQLESVNLLLAAGADVNAVSLSPNQIQNNATPDDGCATYAITHGNRTALIYAASNASLPVINALLAAGADTSAKDSTGLTALDYLEGRGPVPKNPVLNAADFKIAARELAVRNPHHPKPKPMLMPFSPVLSPPPPEAGPPPSQLQPNNLLQNLPGQIGL